MEDRHMKSFLQHLYQMCGGDITSDVSMYAVGEQLGLDKAAAGSVAEDLIIDGFAELKTLAGTITITMKGLEALGKGEGSNGGHAASGVHVIGSDEVIGDDDRQVVGGMIEAIKRSISGTGQRYEELEELVIDIKTIETQLLSPRPKTSVIKSILTSIARQFDQHGEKQLSGDIDEMVGNSERYP